MIDPEELLTPAAATVTVAAEYIALCSIIVSELLWQSGISYGTYQ